MLNEIPKDIMYCYLGGIMLGGVHQKPTVDWRYKVRKHYEDYKGKGRYEISFLDPWNGEVDFTNYIASPILFPLQTSFSYLYLKALRVFDKGNYSFARREIRAVAMDRFKTEGLEYFDF